MYHVEVEGLYGENRLFIDCYGDNKTLAVEYAHDKRKQLDNLRMTNSIIVTENFNHEHNIILKL